MGRKSGIGQGVFCQLSRSFTIDRETGGSLMSEYQYYEFQTVDQPLSERQMSELRQLSTRAEITTTSFTNEYHWGDFRGRSAEDDGDVL